ncbi:hypothetical protein [Paracoccus tegillarcae]|uniref:Uncharacterized protein n=1 Tax=Paracoccus tegillarcae TaxID=1529068 RepID=A0A2K9EDD3_9RHOB|nr:hypothetical protein [Paracoccus tegillarcae]AUH32299.1 hypothetical protein CUV01_01820 [Paracoccus tegillarcae]
MKEIFLETRLEASPSRIWAEVNRPQLLRYVARPLVMVKPHDPSAVAERWHSRVYVVGLYLFGVLPFGRQVIGLSRPVAARRAGRAAISAG